MCHVWTSSERNQIWNMSQGMICNSYLSCQFLNHFFHSKDLISRSYLSLQPNSVIPNLFVCFYLASGCKKKSIVPYTIKKILFEVFFITYYKQKNKKEFKRKHLQDVFKINISLVTMSLVFWKHCLNKMIIFAL